MRTGTSGWSYPEWVGSFYPPGTKPARMLGVYAETLGAVEAHATYRRLPAAAALERWRDQVPSTFRFAPKAHMGITHRRDLDGIEDRVAAFLAAVAPLGERVGPVLLSLPHLEPDLGRLDRLLTALPRPPAGPVAAFELGPRWHIGPVLDRLEAHGATLAVVDDDSGGAPGPLSVGPVAYLRLRRAEYDDGSLAAWAERLAKHRADGRDGYVFFKHDDDGAGPAYARWLAALVDEA
ncbi:MAG: hypothetical protein QOD63_216 [Actinomycetota bacterium]|nr:hypothetical protein [Actinomycetota bacterium]